MQYSNDLDYKEKTLILKDYFNKKFIEHKGLNSEASLSILNDKALRDVFLLKNLSTGNIEQQIMDFSKLKLMCRMVQDLEKELRILVLYQPRESRSSEYEKTLEELKQIYDKEIQWYISELIVNPNDVIQYEAIYFSLMQAFLHLSDKKVDKKSLEIDALYDFFLEKALQLVDAKKIDNRCSHTFWFPEDNEPLLVRDSQ